MLLADYEVVQMRHANVILMHYTEEHSVLQYNLFLDRKSHCVWFFIFKTPLRMSAVPRMCVSVWVVLLVLALHVTKVLLRKIICSTWNRLLFSFSI